jgi:hypothetical protein
MAKTPANTNTPDETPEELPGTEQIPAEGSATAPMEQPILAQPIVAPTEQIPLEPAPVSASAAASGGATGLSSGQGKRGTPSTPGPNGYSDLTRADTQPSVFRRHPVATGVTAGVIAVILVSGLTAWGVGTAVTASLTSSNSAAMPMSTGAPAAAGSSASGSASGRSAAGRTAFRGTIESIDGNSWTVLTRKGKTVTVDVTSSTRFGTKKSGETSASFAVGDSVIVVATKDAGGTPTATRVVNAADLGGALGTGEGAGAGAGTGSSTGSDATTGATSGT